MGANEVGFGLNDTQFSGDELDKYKGEKGKKHRVGIVYDVFEMPDASSPAYKKVLAQINAKKFEKEGDDHYKMARLYQNNVHKYIQGVGYIIETETSTDVLAEYAKKYKREKSQEKDFKEYDPAAAPRFASLVVQYHVDPKTGQLPEDDEGNSLYQGTLKLWVFGLKIFKQLQNINMDYPLLKHDLRIECEGEQFQNLIINNAPESLWRSDAKREKRVLVEAKKHWKQAISAVGRNMTDDQIRDKLGLAPVGVTITPSASDDDFDTIADEIA